MNEKHYERIADIYDVFVRGEFDIPFFLQETKKAKGTVLELMAGTGRVSLPLAEAGIDLVCVDFSAEMLDLLQKKLEKQGLKAELRQADVTNFDLGRQFELIILPFHAFPEITGREKQVQALKRIKAHLSEGGTFICTLHNPSVRKQSIDNQNRLAGRFPTESGEMFVWLHQRFMGNEGLVEVLEFFEFYDAEGVMTNKLFSELQFHLLEKADFESMIAEVGFEVVEFYGDYAYSPFDEAKSPVMVWVLK
jgi:SAM-dependent methyltransferase